MEIEWGFWLGLAAITLGAIALLVYFGRRLSRAAEQRAAEIDLPLYVTPSGTILFACVVAFWVVCAVAHAFYPESSLGALVGEADGVFIVVLGSVSFAGVAAIVLERLGIPVATRDRQS